MMPGATVEVTILVFIKFSKKIRSEHNHQECPRGQPTPVGQGLVRRPDPASKLGAWVQVELNPSRKLPHRPSDQREKNNETRLKTAQPIQLPETDTRLKVAQPIQRNTPRHTHPATTETSKTKRSGAQRTPANDQKPIQYQHAAQSI